MSWADVMAIDERIQEIRLASLLADLKVLAEEIAQREPARSRYLLEQIAVYQENAGTGRPTEPRLLVLGDGMAAQLETMAGGARDADEIEMAKSLAIAWQQQRPRLRREVTR